MDKHAAVCLSRSATGVQTNDSGRCPFRQHTTTTTIGEMMRMSAMRRGDAASQRL